MAGTRPIVVTCDAGIRVVLLGASESAAELGTAAEDLLADGAQVEVVMGIDRAPARLVEAVRRTHAPALFVLCRRVGALDGPGLRALFDDAAGPGQHWVECDVDETLGRRISAELARVASEQHGIDVVPSDNAIDDLFEAASTRAAAPPAHDEVSGVVSIQQPWLQPPSPREAIEADRRQARGLVLAGLALACMFALFVAAQVGRAAPTTPVEPRAAHAVVEPPPASVAAVPTPSPTKPAAPVLVPTIPVPVVVSVPEPPAPIVAGDEQTQLDIAIERKLVTVHRGLVVAAPIMGERPWSEAMTSCRARPFHYARGWRVPTRKELVALARAGVLPDAHVWSSTRGDRRGETSVVVHGRDGAVSTAARDEASAITVCVKRR